MENKRKRIPGPVIEIGIVVVLALLIWIFVDANILGAFRDDIAGSCFSVVFDKPAVKGADRVIVYEGDQVITITDRATVRQIADLFMVANCTDQCNPGSERRIEIYNGNRLVRELRQTQCGIDLYYSYERDLLHWVFPSGCGIGEVQLSQEEHQWLDGVIEQHYRE